MCLAIPGKVIKIDGRKATVSYPGVEALAMVGEDGVKEGDYVMVQMGIITKILDEEQALSSQQAWEETLKKQAQG